MQRIKSIGIVGVSVSNQGSTTNLHCEHLSWPLGVEALVSETQHRLVSRYMAAMLGELLKL